MAVLLVAVGVIVRVVLTRVMGPDMSTYTYTPFLPFVILAALIGGLGPGLLATLATAVVVNYWLLPPAWSFTGGSPGDAVNLVFLWAIGIVVSVMAELYQRTRSHLDELVVVRTTALNQTNERLRQEAAERQRAEEEVRESEERLRFALGSARMGMWDWDVRTGQGRVTPQNQRIYGLPEDAVEHNLRDYFLLIDPDDLPRVEQAVVRTAQTGDHYEEEYRIHRPDGAARWIHSEGRLVHLPDGRTRFIGVSYDVTARRQGEDMLREWNATLERTVAQRTAELRHRAEQLQKLTLDMSEAEDRERKRIADIMHDDLQQILAGARFHVSMMNSRVKHDPSLQEIAVQIKHMLKEAIEKSRSLSHELSPAMLHHGDLTEALGWLVRQMWTKHGLLVHVYTDDAVCLQSDSIAALLYRMAQELLFNVVQYAGVEEARLRIRRRGPYICLSGSDRGRGFDPRGLREAAGYGLLSIRERLELLGGCMRIKSAKDRGSTFFIAVPDSATAGKSQG